MSTLHWWGQIPSSTKVWPGTGNDSCSPKSIVDSALLPISYHIITSGGAMATAPEKRKALLSVRNTPFWRRHANVLFLIRENIKGKPVMLCKCYANAITGKHCKCVWVYTQERTHFHYWWDLSMDRTFPQEPTDLLTFKHACMHTWAGAPSAAGIKSHQLARSSWFIWEIEQTPEGKFEFSWASLYVWPGQN